VQISWAVATAPDATGRAGRALGVDPRGSAPAVAALSRISGACEPRRRRRNRPIAAGELENH
jgi:hypothetical protein